MKSTKKLIVSIVVLVIALVVSVSSTFAWFTINSQVDASGFDLTVTNGDGLYASVGDSTVYTSTLTITPSNFKMRDATTTDGIAFKDEGGTVITANEPTTANPLGTYFSVKLNFRSNSALKVVLVDTSKVVAKGTAPAKPIYAWEEITLSKYTTDTTMGTTPVVKGEVLPTTRAANAARVSFVDGTTAKVWDPNKTTGYTIQTATANLAAEYRNALLGGTNTTFTVPMVDTVIPQAVAGTAVGDAAKITTLVKAKNSSFYEASVTVNIWLEGWDADCFNGILTDIFTTNLSFKGIA